MDLPTLTILPCHDQSLMVMVIDDEHHDDNQYAVTDSRSVIFVQMPLGGHRFKLSL